MNSKESSTFYDDKESYAIELNNKKNYAYNG